MHIFHNKKAFLLSQDEGKNLCWVNYIIFEFFRGKKVIYSVLFLI